MGIFDSLKNIAESTIKREASKTIANAVNSIGKGKTGLNALALLLFHKI